MSLNGFRPAVEDVLHSLVLQSAYQKNKLKNAENFPRFPKDTFPRTAVKSGRLMGVVSSQKEGQDVCVTSEPDEALVQPRLVSTFFCAVPGTLRSLLADLQQFFTGKLYVLVYQLKLPAEELLWLAISWHIRGGNPKVKAVCGLMPSFLHQSQIQRDSMFCLQQSFSNLMCAV